MAVAASFSVLLFFLLGPSGSSSEPDRESAPGAGLLLVSEHGKRSLESESRPAEGPETRGRGMRQLLVMSPHTFLGYEFWLAGRSLLSLPSPSPLPLPLLSAPSPLTYRSAWLCLPADPGDQPPRRKVLRQLLQMAENHPAPEQLR